MLHGRHAPTRSSSQACGIKGQIELVRLVLLHPEFSGPRRVSVLRTPSRLYCQLSTNIGTKWFVELLESGSPLRQRTEEIMQIALRSDVA